MDYAPSPSVLQHPTSAAAKDPLKAECHPMHLVLPELLGPLIEPAPPDEEGNRGSEAALYTM